MGGSSRQELGLSSVDGSSYAAGNMNGQRGNFSSPCLERSGSFRDGSDSRGSVAGSSTPRSISSLPENPPFFQYVQLDLFPMGERKYSRYGEIRRLFSASLDESLLVSGPSKPARPVAPEEVRRFKMGLNDSTSKARDRAMLMQESIVKLDKYRTILTRKRQRCGTEKLSSASMSKMGAQTQHKHTDFPFQKFEDKTKNVFANRRARSSLADGQPEGLGTAPAKEFSTLDEDKSLTTDKSAPKASNVAQSHSDDKIRGLYLGGDGWQKKLKRKRSVGIMFNKAGEGDFETKQGVQNRRLNESFRLRPGSSSGAVGNQKIDGNSSQNSSGYSVAIKVDGANVTLPNDRRERPSGLDKEHFLAKGGNKQHISEDSHAGGLGSLGKGKGSRMPRTNSVVVINSSSKFSRLSGGADGSEEPSCLNKVQPSQGIGDHKRMLSGVSASLPGAQWVRQRPQKISRIRRANVVSPISNIVEEDSGSGTAARLTPTDSTEHSPQGTLLSRSQLPKVKFENIQSPVGLSECEELGDIENKLKLKTIDNDDVQSGLGGVNKTIELAPSKNKTILLKERVSDGVRRQGRSGRNFSVQPKSCLILSNEKLETVDTPKPSKTGGYSDKNERLGCRPTKKSTERKSVKHRQFMPNGTFDIAAETNDDRDELLAAINDARNASIDACSSLFWKKMDPCFYSITQDDISFVKNEITFVEELSKSSSSVLADEQKKMVEPSLSSRHSSVTAEHCNTNGILQNKHAVTACLSDDSQLPQTSSEVLDSEQWFDRNVPLSHRILSAFILEDSNQHVDSSSECGDDFHQISNDRYPFEMSTQLENGYGAHGINSMLDFSEGLLNSHKSMDKALCNGFATATGLRSSSVQNFVHGDGLLCESVSAVLTQNESLPEFMPRTNQLQNFGGHLSADPRNGLQFEHMSLNEKVMMELHNIGLRPETVPELDEGEEGEIDQIILKLKMTLGDELKQKKAQLCKLQKAMQDVNGVTEKNIEQLAMEKLVLKACRRMMGGRGGHKSKASKVSKQHTLAFATRTLARCREFEETGHSCFREHALWDALSIPFPRNFKFPKDDSAEKIGAKRMHDRIPMDGHYRPRMQEPSLGGQKWKKADRVREQDEEAVGRSTMSKVGRPSPSNGRSEQKTKPKQKQKIARLSATGNGLGRVIEPPNLQALNVLSVSENRRPDTRVSNEGTITTAANVANTSVVDTGFINSQMQGMVSFDDLEVPDDLGAEGQDIGSWFGVVDEDALQDHDLMGLQIPTDDLSDLNFI